MVMERRILMSCVLNFQGQQREGMLVVPLSLLSPAFELTISNSVALFQL